jgi:hypothetical protein
MAGALGDSGGAGNAGRGDAEGGSELTDAAALGSGAGKVLVPRSLRSANAATATTTTPMAHRVARPARPEDVR